MTESFCISRVSIIQKRLFVSLKKFKLSRCFIFILIWRYAIKLLQRRNYVSLCLRNANVILLTSYFRHYLSGQKIRFTMILSNRKIVLLQWFGTSKKEKNLTKTKQWTWSQMAGEMRSGAILSLLRVSLVSPQSCFLCIILFVLLAL